MKRILRPSSPSTVRSRADDRWGNAGQSRRRPERSEHDGSRLSVGAVPETPSIEGDRVPLTAGAAAVGLLPETFIHIAGIGPKIESRLWESGVLSWDALRETGFVRRPGVSETLARSEEALLEDDLNFFFQALPPRERWRAFAHFADRFVAVDIETTGMSHYDEITVIGTEVGGEYRTFVRGANLDAARELLNDAAGLITFNGALFDLPFIQRAFPDVKLPQAHVDLRFLGRRVGYAGPLKTVERAAQLHRDDDLGDISGYEATVLWNEYQFEGAIRSLLKLVAYNAADTAVLRPLAQLVVERLRGTLSVLRRGPAENGLLFDSTVRSAPPPRRSNKVRPLPRVHVASDRLRVGDQELPLPKRRSTTPEVTVAELGARMRNPQSRIVGIDLTGSAARPTGWSLLEGGVSVTGTLRTTHEIIARTLECEPRLVSIDSPLSLPVGRDCTDDDCPCRAVGGIMRACERELKRRGVNVYPCLIQSMQALTRRGREIATALRGAGVEVIESYPGAAQDIMRIPRKRASQEQLHAGLERFGLRGLRSPGDLTHDELDAATSAAVGAFYLGDLYEALGNAIEEYLIVPSLASTPASVGTAPRAGRADVGTHRFLVLGPGAATAVSALGISHSAWHERSSGTVVYTAAEVTSLWEGLAAYGPRLRVAYIDAPGVRLPRRPVFADLQLSLDDPERTRKLKDWLAQWDT